MSDDLSKGQNDAQTGKAPEKPAVHWYSRLGNVAQITAALMACVAAGFSGINWLNSDSAHDAVNLHNENMALRIQNEQIKSDYRIAEANLKEI